MTATLEKAALPMAPPAGWRARLQPLVSDGGGWAVTLFVTLIAGLLRFVRLDQPATAIEDGKVRIGYIFDEQYYACDAQNLLRYGVEHSAPTGSAWCAPGDDPAFIVHPPLGKWMIAIGEKLFGFDTFGWRFSAALFGTLSVLLVVRIARRMTGSDLLGGLAGLLLALDGMHFVESRTATLDIFLTFWIVAAFGALVVDRDRVRARLAGATQDELDRGGTLGSRPWLMLAGVCVGAALATKWSGVFALVPLVALGIVWETGARRAAGIREPFPWRTATGLALGLALALLLPVPGVVAAWAALLGLLLGLGWEAVARDAAGLRLASLPGALVRHGGLWVTALVVLPLAVYVISWTGWFVTDSGYDRHWAEGRGTSLPFLPDFLGGVIPDALRSWWHYHADIWNFHSTLTAKHPYQSHPLSWPFLGRPVSYYYPPGIGLGRYGCTTQSCSREVLAIGTPMIWWAMVPACLLLVARWVARRDWRAGALALMIAVPVLAWIPSDLKGRTMFLFYALPSIPFLCIGLALIAGWAMNARRTAGTVGVGIYVSLVVANFAWFYPILAAVTLPYAEWYDRMLFRSWI